ncbi:unnamed protein product [Choristocarpus tenellus]
MCLPCFRMVGSRQKMEQKTILKDVSGVFKPGTITLVVGPPGCGKSSLLKLMAGRLREDKGHIHEGEVLYNGDLKSSGKFSLPKVAHLVEQTDRHLPTLMVEETLMFAFQSMCGGKHLMERAEGSTPLTKEQEDLCDFMDKRALKVQLIMLDLGLLRAKDTVVGNNMLRGVSGGERRRVTTGEMLCGPQSCFLLDSISTGLDASTTFDIIFALRLVCKEFNTTAVVTLLQPPPEVYGLFDEVCVMAEGSVIYHGPREDCMPHFNSLGKDEADWLVELTGEIGRAYRMDPAELMDRGLGPPPETPQEFSAKWQETSTYNTLMETLSTSNDDVPKKWPKAYTHTHGGSWLYYTRLCCRRQFSLLRRDVSFVKSQVLMAIAMGLVVGSIFFDLELEDANAKFGFVFFSLLFLATGGMAQIPTAVANRSVLHKQADAGFYPTSCELVASVIASNLVTGIQAVIYAPLMYFMASFTSSDGGWRFFTFMVIVMVTIINLAQWFRLLPMILPDFTVAQGAGGVSVLLTILFGGYLIPANIILDFWIWLFHINPIAWAFRGCVLNEFQSDEYRAVCGVVNPDGSCAKDLGKIFLDAYGFKDDQIYIWGSVLVVTLEFIIVCILTGLAQHYIRWDTSDSAPLGHHATGEDEEADKREAGTNF